jgi:hypothetical protein
MGEQPTKTVGVYRTTTPETPSGESVLTGEHTVSAFVARMSREWQPKERSAQRFKDDVVKKLEQLLNNTSSGSPNIEDPGGGSPGTEPDLFYDTGYMWLICSTHPSWKAGDEYVDITHNLGQVPTRYTVFFSNNQKPDPNNPQHAIYVVAPFFIVDGNSEWVGWYLSITGTNSIRLKVAKDRLFQSGSSQYKQGNFRILMWR